MMKAIEKYSLISALEDAIEAAKQIPCETRCDECGHFQAGKCMNWGEIIPEETLPTGCYEWKWNPLTPPF